MDLCTVADVKLAGGIPDGLDERLAREGGHRGLAVLEAEARRWLAPRGALTRLFDGAVVRDGGRVLPVPDGVSTLTPSPLSTRTSPTAARGRTPRSPGGSTLRGALRDGWPATGSSSTRRPSGPSRSPGTNVVKVAGSWGPAAVYPRVAELAATASSAPGAPATARRRAGTSPWRGPTGALRSCAGSPPPSSTSCGANFAPDTRPALRLGRGWLMAPPTSPTVMDGLAAAVASTGLVREAHAWPPGALAVPACLVDYPSRITLAATFGRGSDLLEVPVLLLAAQTFTREGRDALAAYLAAATTRGGARGPARVGTAHVGEAEVTTAVVGGITYLALKLTVEVAT